MERRTSLRLLFLLRAFVSLLVMPDAELDGCDKIGIRDSSSNNNMFTLIDLRSIDESVAQPSILIVFKLSLNFSAQGGWFLFREFLIRGDNPRWQGSRKICFLQMTACQLLVQLRRSLSKFAPDGRRDSKNIICVRPEPRRIYLPAAGVKPHVFRSQLHLRLFNQRSLRQKGPLWEV